ncbi:inositol monophosphatase family protein [bacterium]|jgi:myo-inositol-1(or 4)-monophosphatase|nr:inositol monophosphatase family protein [bacterium]
MRREEFLKVILKEVGSTVLKKKNKSSTYSYDKGFFAESDLIAHETFKKEINKHFPEDFVLTEEDDINLKNINFKNEYYWVIDPICGTTNYLYDIPFYSHSATILQNDKLYAAGVFDPIRKELFFAFKNRFYVNEKQFTLTKNTPMKEALISINTNQSNFDEVHSLNKIINKLSPPVSRRTRIIESANLELSYVACGRIDAYYNPTDKPWDIAAAQVLIPSAGGAVHIINNSDSRIFKQSGIVAASSKNLLNEILNALTKIQ